MRQIEFKFWNTVKNEWCTKEFDIELSQSEEDETVFEYGNMVYADAMDTLVFVPCQYTGRKDKHGNKAYDGHIIKILDYYNNVFYIKYVDEKCAFYLTDGTDEILYLMCESIGTDEFEIIGHICETPNFMREPHP